MAKPKDRHAALYCRVSTDAQFEEGYSIDVQKEMLAAYCVSKGIKKYEHYIDGGFSGSNIERPELSRLISDILNDKISHVIVYKLDRLSRSQKDTLYLIEDVLMPHDVSFVSMNENMDTSTPIGRAMLGIMSAFAQLERETIRERTRMGMKERVKEGYWPGGGKIPFGYDYDSGRGILVPNSDAPTVRLIYELYLKGWSMMRIAKFTGLKYERLAEQIIKRKTNAGYIVYNGIEYKGRHEAIISEETYNKAMQEIELRSRGGGKGSQCLLAGLIYCGVCGAKMRYQKWGKRGYKIYCYSQDKGKPHLHKSDSCNNYKLWADEVENNIICDLFLVASKVKKKNDESDNGNIISILEKQIEKLSRRLKNLYSLYGDNADCELEETILQTRGELDSAKKQLNELKNKEEVREKFNDRISDLDSVEETWEYMTITEKQNILRSFIEKIVVTYNNIEIYYKLLTAGEN